MTELAGEYIAVEDAHRKRRKLDPAFVAEVLKVVEMHSSANPIRAIDLAHHFEHEHDRYVRAAITVLLEDGHPIASTTNRKNAGYFYTRTQSEANAYIKQLRSRAVENFARLKAYTFAAKNKLHVHVEQLRLEL